MLAKHRPNLNAPLQPWWPFLNASFTSMLLAAWIYYNKHKILLASVEGVASYNMPRAAGFALMCMPWQLKPLAPNAYTHVCMYTDTCIMWWDSTPCCESEKV
mmetsp:Transcript_81782/g.144317  ORF Transcript_81782/g.144317 Transcript_81782/m.144317 type:complete len:102 (-) Transcript_81782:1660-1965(-)